jgi:hypothetical protein
MTFLPVPGRASGDLFTETMWDRYIRDNMNKGVLRPIADSGLLGGATATISFSSVPTDFEALLVTACVRGDAAALSILVYVRFNDDAGNNYDREELNGPPNPGESLAEAGVLAWNVPAANAPASAFTGGPLLIAGANRAGQKWAYSIGTTRTANASGGMTLLHRCFCWRSTAVITKLTIVPSTGNFVANSRFTLYGLGGT